VRHERSCSVCWMNSNVGSLPDWKASSSAMAETGNWPKPWDWTRKPWLGAAENCWPERSIPSVFAVLEAGAGAGIQPIGLGARDTLRLEATLPLYGHELDDATSPLAAGLARFVALDGEDFIGRAALLAERDAGIPRRLVGLELREPGIARQGYRVLAGGDEIGAVTSGTHAPTLGRALALAYVDAAHAALGTALAVDIRGRGVAAVVVPTPFYKRTQRR